MPVKIQIKNPKIVHIELSEIAFWVSVIQEDDTIVSYTVTSDGELKVTPASSPSTAKP